MTTREELARELTSARERTLRLVELDDTELLRQYDPLMSPLVWDLAHIGWQEEMWLLRGNDPRRPGLLEPAVERLYDAFEHSRASRVNLPLLPPTDARSFVRTVRDKSLDALEALPAGQKLMLRVGPEQQKRLRTKLIELRAALTRSAPPR